MDKTPFFIEIIVNFYADIFLINFNIIWIKGKGSVTCNFRTVALVNLFLHRF